MTPAQRFQESQKLWSTFLALGGSLDPEPDSQSPFYFEEASGSRASRKASHGGFRMKRHAIRYTDEWCAGPMSFWVHVQNKPRRRGEQPSFRPPLPRPVPGKGYPHYYVEVDGFVFEFASLNELDVCIATFSQKALPSTDRETAARGTGPSPHWLNRLPPGTHRWRYRFKAVKAFQQAREDFQELVGGSLPPARAAARPRHSPSTGRAATKRRLVDDGRTRRRRTKPAAPARGRCKKK
jgi:hypothetical protein